MHQDNRKILITSEAYPNNHVQQVSSRKAKILSNVNYMKQSIQKTWERDKIVMYSSSRNLFSSPSFKREVIIYQGNEQLKVNVKDPQLILLVLTEVCCSGINMSQLLVLVTHYLEKKERCAILPMKISIR